MLFLLKKNMSTLFKYCYGKLYQKLYRILSIKPKTVTSTVNDITYELDLSQSIDSSIYFFGCFEADVTKNIAQFTKPGMTVLDIGANIGCHTLPIASLVGNTGKVIAFEPMDWARNKLNKNISLNNFSNISVEKIALSDKHETQTLRFRSNWPLDNHYQQEANVKQNITLETLDNYVKKMDIKVDLIKIDVDGYEYKIFKGAHHLLKTHKPIICTEIGHTTQRVGDSVEEMIKFLSSLGYNFYSIKDLKQIHDPMDVIRTLPDNGAMNMMLINEIN